jgi:hypothetical protein
MMTKSELIEVLTREQRHLEGQGVELAISPLLEHMGQAPAAGASGYRSPRLQQVPRRLQDGKGVKRSSKPEG